jgi:hypothetical protein
MNIFSPNIFSPLFQTVVRVCVIAMLGIAAGTFSSTTVFAQAAAPAPQLTFLSRWTSTLPVQGGGGLCESITYDAVSRRLFVANSIQPGTGQRYTRVEVINMANPLQPVTEASLDLSSFGADVSSIAVSNGVLAAAMIQAVKTDSGRVVMFNIRGTAILNATTSAVSVVVGAQPDMICFTPDGRRVLTANEGEPTDGVANNIQSYLPDPEGSVSIIDLPAAVDGVVNISGVRQQSVRTVRFNEFNYGGARRSELGADSLRLHYPSPTTTATLTNTPAGVTPGRLVTFAQDMEPEYITVSADSRTAYVGLQEANGWAIIDLDAGRVRSIRSLGFKNHNLPGNGFDASDRGTNINIANYPVLGMYQPDALSTFTSGGRNYIVSVNEGDTRGYLSFNEETRLNATAYVLDPTRFPNAATLKNDTLLGRLTVTRSKGDTDGDGDFDEIYSFGGRSISVWDDAGALVWDSGDQWEQITARQLPAYFNASRDNNTRKNRSDDKGPEPEGVTVGTVGDSTYAFAGLERTGGVIVYNITNPTAPRFSQYITTRNYSTAIAGDVSTEALVFIPATQNSLNRPLLVAAHEVSGTVSVFAFDRTTSTRERAEDFGVRMAYLAPDRVLLDIPTRGAVAMEVIVSNVQGSTLRHEVVTGLTGERVSETVRFDGMASGVYFVTLRIGQHTVTQKVMINR